MCASSRAYLSKYVPASLSKGRLDAALCWEIGPRWPLKALPTQVGRIDAGYRGEILVCLINVNQPTYQLSLERDREDRVTGATLEKSDVSVLILKGDKIVQMSPFQAMTHFEIAVVDQLTPSDRASQGFGSSGR